MYPEPPTKISGKEVASVAQAPQKECTADHCSSSNPKVSFAVFLSISKNALRPKDVPDSLTARIPRGSSPPWPLVKHHERSLGQSLRRASNEALS